MTKSFAALAALMMLVACQTTERPADLAQCKAILKGALSAEVIRARYGDPNMRKSLQCAAEEGDIAAQQQLGELLILGHDPKGSFYQGLFWLALAERDGAADILSAKGRSQRDLFRASLTRPEAAQLQADIRTWDMSRREPEATLADRMTTFFVNDRKDLAGTVFEEGMRRQNPQMSLMMGVALTGTGNSASERREGMDMIEAAVRDNDAVAQFIYGSSYFSRSFKSDMTEEEATRYLVASLQSFDPERRIPDTAYKGLIRGLATNDKEALTAFRAQGPVSEDFSFFLSGLEQCFGSFEGSKCRSEGVDYMKQASDGGNGVAAAFFAVINGSKPGAVDATPYDIRALRAVLSGRTKGGL